MRRRPITPYGRSKLEGERVVLATPGLKSAILRPGAVYGPGTDALLPLFRAAALGVLPLAGRAGAAYTFIHVGDVVRAITAAIDVDVSGAVFVGHARPVTTRQLLEAVRDASGGHGGDRPGAARGHAGRGRVRRCRRADHGSRVRHQPLALRGTGGDGIRLPRRSPARPARRRGAGRDRRRHRRDGALVSFGRVVRRARRS